MKDAYYFPHDSNAQHDEKILQLRSKHGWQGYGIYWAIIEKLRESTSYKFSLTAIPGLSLSLSHPQAELQALLEDCYQIGLLTKNEEYFHSESLTRRMCEIDSRRESLREFGRRGGIASSQAKAKLKPPSSSKVKESKGKKRKEESTTPSSAKTTFNPPTQDDVKKYCLDRGNTIDPAGFIDFYGSKGWMIGKNHMKDWRAAVRTWERRNAVKKHRDPALTPEEMRAGH